MKKLGIGILIVLIIGLIILLVNFDKIKNSYYMRQMLKKGVVNEKFIEGIYNKKGDYALISIIRELDNVGQFEAGDKIARYIYDRYKKAGKSQNDIEIFLTDIEKHKNVYIEVYKEIINKKINDINKMDNIDIRMAEEEKFFIYLQTIRYYKEIVKEAEKILENKNDKNEMVKIYNLIKEIYKANNENSEVNRINEILKTIEIKK